MIEVSHTNIPLSRTSKSNKSSKVASTNLSYQNVPGWKTFVKPVRDTAIFWYNIWKSAERPNKGVLYEIMKKTRNNYHFNIRKVKKMADNIRSQQLLDAAMNGDIKLMKEMKKVNNPKSSNSNLPETVDGAVGQDEGVDKFKEVYYDLYNSAESSEAVELIKIKLNETIG